LTKVRKIIILVLDNRLLKVKQTIVQI